MIVPVVVFLTATVIVCNADCDPPQCFDDQINKAKTLYLKGASTDDIRKIFGFFNPLPLVRIRNGFILKIHATSLTTFAFP